MARGTNMPPSIWRERLQKARVEKAAEVAAIKLEGARQVAREHRSAAEYAEAEAARLEAIVNSGDGS